MRIDALDTVDVRFHHRFKSRLEDLNQRDVESESKRAKKTSNENRSFSFLNPRIERWNVPFVGNNLITISLM